MMSSTLKILIVLFIFSMSSALPQDRNYIRTQRKIQNNHYRHHGNTIYFEDNQDLPHPKAKIPFRLRAAFADNDGVDYDDVEVAPINFTPAPRPPSLIRKLPKVDGSKHAAKPQQQHVPASRQPVRPSQSPGSAIYSGNTVETQPRRGLSNCGRAISQCCHLYAYHNKVMPKCFEHYGCPGGYYDAPCSPEKQNQMSVYLRPN